MTIIQFPVSGLTNSDLAAIEQVCAERRERGIGSYVSARTLDEPGTSHHRLVYASIMDELHGRTVFIVDKSDAIYRVRYFNTIKRRMVSVAEGRSLRKVLNAIPEWPSASFQKGSG
jgi:hypothetical protein